jgi:hypothetical protein
MFSFLTHLNLHIFTIEFQPTSWFPIWKAKLYISKLVLDTPRSEQTT